MPRFSIIIPVYNVEEFLEDCLESVELQTFDDYEVVIINDGSTDNSLKICKEYALNHSGNTTIINQKNSGLLLARRAGIDSAKGEYIISLDSDDKLRIDALEIIDRAIRRTNSDVIIFQASRSEYFDVPYLNYDRLYSAMEDNGFLSKELCQELLLTTHDLNSIWSKAIRTRCIGQKESFKQYSGLQYGEDLLQMMHVFDTAKSYTILNDIIYYYRDNFKSISHSVNSSRLTNIRVVRSCLETFAKDWNPSLLSMVRANSSIEVLAYCIICVSRLSFKTAYRYISSDEVTNFLKEVYIDSDFSNISVYKRYLTRMLYKEQHIRFILTVRILLSILKIINPSVARRYQ